MVGQVLSKCRVSVYGKCNQEIYLNGPHGNYQLIYSHLELIFRALIYCLSIIGRDSLFKGQALLQLAITNDTGHMISSYSYLRRRTGIDLGLALF